MRLLIFDFDGVVADSERLACAVLAEVAGELGVPLSLDETMRTFIGERFAEVRAALARRRGQPVTDLEADALRRRTLERFRAELREVDGVRGYLEAFAHLRRCIASSSSPARLSACLEILGLSDAFGAHVYSADTVRRGKPHPDLFLHAARACGVEPAEAIVIEDGENGIRGAVAAGMTPVGFVGGSHVAPGHAERLAKAGAVAVARDYRELAAITRRLLG